MPLGTIPTPAVAYLTIKVGADAGVVISASHNPFEHNGIKVFNGQGYKLPDALEDRVEEKILSSMSEEMRVSIPMVMSGGQPFSSSRVTETA